MERSKSAPLIALDRMLLIGSFQELVLSRKSREAILDKGQTGIRPEFGDTFFQKICLNMHMLNIFVAAMCVAIFGSDLTIRINRSKRLSVPMMQRNFVYSIGIGLGLLCIYICTKLVLLYISGLFMKRRLRGNTIILSNLGRHCSWWNTNSGKDFYRHRMEAKDIVTALAIQYCADFCTEHLDSMQDYEYKNSSIVHIYDPKMMNWAIPFDEKSSLEQGAKFCDVCCKHIDRASQYLAP